MRRNESVRVDWDDRRTFPAFVRAVSATGDGLGYQTLHFLVAGEQFPPSC